MGIVQKHQIEVEPGRYGATISWRGQEDTNAVIGYDEPMGTYFCQAFEEGPDGEPRLWLGRDYGEYLTLDQLKEGLKYRGATILEWELEQESPIRPRPAFWRRIIEALFVRKIR